MAVEVSLTMKNWLFNQGCFDPGPQVLVNQSQKPLTLSPSPADPVNRE